MPVSRIFFMRQHLVPNMYLLSVLFVFDSLEGVPGDSKLQGARLHLHTWRLGAREARGPGGGVGNGGLRHPQDQGAVGPYNRCCEVRCCSILMVQRWDGGFRSEWYVADWKKFDART